MINKEQFLQAVEDGDLEVVKKYIQAVVVDVNIKNDAKDTALVWASGNSHLTIVEYLIEMGATVSDNDLRTCRKRFLDVDALLINFQEEGTYLIL